MVATPAPLGAAIALTEGHFVDPFAYCAAVGTIGTSDARDTRPALPDAVARGLKAVLALPADAPSAALLRNSIWRCMNGKVYACTVGANLPCAEKADTRRDPAPELVDFCGQNPGAESHPDGGDRPGHRVRVALRGRAPGDRPPVRATGRGGLSRARLVPDRPGRALNLWQNRGRSWRFSGRVSYRRASRGSVVFTPERPWKWNRDSGVIVRRAAGVLPWSPKASVPRARRWRCGHSLTWWRDGGERGGDASGVVPWSASRAASAQQGRQFLFEGGPHARGSREPSAARARQD